MTPEELLLLMAHMRRVTGDPWWPLEPPVPVRKSPEALAELEANIQITCAMRHNVGPAETDARLRKAERLARRAANDDLAREARHRRRDRV